MKRAAWLNSLMSANLLSINPSKTEYLVIGLPQQTAKVNNPSLAIDSNNVLQPVSYARDLEFLIDNNLSFDQQISALSRTCPYHLRDLRRIRLTLNFHTANIIATSLIQSKLDYCNFTLPQLTGSLHQQTSSHSEQHGPCNHIKKKIRPHLTPCTGSKSKNAPTTK